MPAPQMGKGEEAGGPGGEVRQAKVLSGLSFHWGEAGSSLRVVSRKQVTDLTEASKEQSGEITRCPPADE